ncbi:hypothetical protein ACLUWO_05680 [Pseudoscardovia radai]|uniref:hypothetical protein n=1 Tax=Pseudoscardovia radai TaxID=987066 RepID=UPI0039948178
MKNESHAEFVEDLHFQELAIQYKDQKWFLDCGMFSPKGRNKAHPEEHFETHAFGLTDNVADKSFTYVGATDEECFENFINGFRELDGKTIFETEPELEIVQPTTELEDID